MADKLKVLLIEDNPGDVLLVKNMLNYGHAEYEITCAERLSMGIKEIKSAAFDVVLLDLGLPDSDGLDSLKKILETNSKVPVIVLTGLSDEATGLQAVKEGAQDYLIKGQIDTNILVRTIKHSIERLKHLTERKKKEEALQKSEAKFRNIIDSSPIPYALNDEDLNI